jgi:hypothetical protein
MHYGSQGHTLFVDVTDIPQPLQLDVVAKWQENAEIIDDTNSNFKYELVSKTSDSKCWYLKVVPTTQCHVLHDRASLPPIVIPELFNLRIEGHNLNISIKNKVRYVKSFVGIIFKTRITTISGYGRYSYQDYGQIRHGGQNQGHEYHI